MALACETCPVRDSAACAVLTNAERDAMAKAGRSKRLGRGETLFHAGDSSTACATLVSGALKVCSFDSEGEERILALIHPSGFIGELFRPFADYDVIALTDSQLCIFSRTDMNRALEQHPALSQALVRRAQEDLHASRELLVLSGKRAAGAKVSTLLLSLAQAASHSSCHLANSFDLPLSRQEMGNLLGLTIETVSRQLTRFEKEGLIERHGARGIGLLDPARLHQLAGASS